MPNSDMNMTERHERLVNYLQDRAGPALRVVFRYDSDGEEYEILYIREEIEKKYSEAELRDHFDTFRRDAHLANVQETKLGTGDHHCSIRIFDETLIFNFTLGSRYNTIISLDPTVGRDLLGFVTEAMVELAETTEDRPVKVPRWV